MKEITVLFVGESDVTEVKVWSSSQRLPFSRESRSNVNTVETQTA